MRSTCILGLVLTLAACESAYIPYVPGEGFEQKIDISLALPDSGTLAVGEWVTINATRESGPWVLSDSTTEDPPCERISPVTQETEAASKVQWIVMPSGAATFNTPAPPEYERRVQFTRPGRYRITATSNGCGSPFESDTIAFVVR